MSRSSKLPDSTPAVCHWSRSQVGSTMMPPPSAASSANQGGGATAAWTGLTPNGLKTHRRVRVVAPWRPVRQVPGKHEPVTAHLVHLVGHPERTGDDRWSSLPWWACRHCHRSADGRHPSEALRVTPSKFLDDHSAGFSEEVGRTAGRRSRPRVSTHCGRAARRSRGCVRSLSGKNR